ncbi:hypothetical protein [Haloplanus natans]|uniref:hypothetical protein n=1 Tax=Haloplanus natans TaxID=376171 RepID=UPI001FE20DD0|nr:hypothetical protein [Haloplanus natans]
MTSYSERPDGGNETTIHLTRERIDDLAAEYGQREPFDLVEREHVETVPRTFTSEDFGRRDAEWPVQWYHRRELRSDPERRDAEERFLDNDYEAMVDAIHGAIEATTLDRKLDALTTLVGVDVPVASAFLAFTHPDDYVAVGRREWEALRAADELADPYPDTVTPAAYRTYVEAVRTVADRTDRDVWTVYRALWRLGTD